MYHLKVKCYMCSNRLSDVWKIEIGDRGLGASKMFFSNLSFSIGFRKELVESYRKSFSEKKGKISLQH